MNNLIINGIDHSVFDLEWAKRGGIVHILDDGIEPTIEYLCLVVPKFNELLVMILQSGNYSFFFSEFTSKRIMRMATPEECADAGVEYIEPPMIWRDIEGAPKNQLILLLQHTLSYGDCIYSGAYVDGEWLDYTGKVHNSPHLWMQRPQQPKDE